VVAPHISPFSRPHANPASPRRSTRPAPIQLPFSRRRLWNRQLSWGRNVMSKFFALICALGLVGLGALSAATAGDTAATTAVYVPSASARAVFQQVSSKPCCYNRGEYFQSTPSTCQRYGGRTVPFEYCERQYWQYQQ